MNNYETLLAEYDGTLTIAEEKMINLGLYCDGYIWINSQQTTSKKACILAEEIGHDKTSVGNILDQSDLNNAKQEQKARVWAYNKLLSVDKVIEAASKGYTTTWDMSEYLDVDEEFLKDYLAWQGILDISL
ncbi:MAG: ImmA/IrrE family metallo-endopeptidase [Emergencia timonensis]|uniref:ImmA/IrrE family metallo-endopeptidase n=1 Tax=Emergencia timonensis TaxID=1776384 RepID=UPI00082D1592|nr:ImmA/IrrE family metallo-endopeptidase [Emergencia timonensis]WNX89888.1 ImmA/IrrE family metallo-endopeptidase [Emergencia timonensis]